MLPLDDILKELSEEDFISIFFITVDLISPNEFLEIVKKDRNFMEKAFIKLLKDKNSDKNFLIEILGTIKKYRCLRLLNCCKHIIKSKPCELNKFWKFLYEVCELMIDDDFKFLKASFPEEVHDSLYPEVLLVKAYQKEIFTEQNLTSLSEVFKYDRPDISKLLDNYKISNNEDFYHMSTPSKSSYCGLAVILNHVHFTSSDNSLTLKTRKDSELDVEALSSLWRKFGFKVIVYTDLTDYEVIELFISLAKEDHSSYDIFVTCYLSHGSEGVVYGSNSKPIPISYLEDIIANQCETLLNKPKLFFIQACQGRTIQQGVFSETITLDSTEMSQNCTNTRISPYYCNETSMYQDVLKVISTIPGFASFGPSNKKSWFIDALVSNIEKYGDELPLMDIMTKVVNQVSGLKGNINGVILKQTPIIYSTLCHKLLLKKCV